MTIYVLNFADTDNYCAYTSKQKAIETLWQSYCDEIAPEIRDKYREEDLETLEEGYITDYGWVAEVELVED